MRILTLLALLAALVCSLIFIDGFPQMPAVIPQLNHWMEGTGHGVGDRTIRVQTLVKEQVLIQCTDITPSGSFTVALNAAGEDYFDEFKDEVNTAISAAVSDAISNMLATAGVRCMDECLEVSGTGEFTAEDGLTGATVAIILGNGGDTQIPLCYDSIEHVRPQGITVNAFAPGVTGWDLSQFISGVTPTDSESGHPNNTQYLADFLAAIPDAICTGSGGVWISREFLFTNVTYGPMKGSLRVEQPPMYNGISIEFRAFPQDPESMVTAPYIAALYDLSGNPSSNTGTLSAVYVDGILGGPLTFPAGFSMTYQNGSTPRTLGGEGQRLPLNNTGGESDTWTPYEDTAALTAGGSMTVAYVAAAPEVGEPGYRPVCINNLYYKNRFPFVEDCTVVQRFDYVTMPDSKYPPGRPPLCSINFRWPGTPVPA